MTTRASTSSEHGRKHSIEPWDMGRMLKFIEQESEQKAHEIKIKANEEYSIAIAELALESERKINRQKANEMNQIKTERTIAEGKLRSNAALSLAREKEKVFNKVMKEVCLLCANQKLSEKIIKETVEKYTRISPNTQMFIHAQEQDIPAITAHVKSLGVAYSIEPMHKNLLGGIVIRNEEKTILVNNSYLERIRKTEVLVMPVIRQTLF
ncbi:V-type H+-transporting ATPase subunit E [Nematocida displodere]|uniref:V-type H+-transporting ATPase subunit E n=1 Tax=Nematocida displodere TaxID=1805483 RepID=A0A177EIY2_9MICR|nr:V-type H+-transporting ATPase subunit E [Nematocida displodere]